MSDTAKTTPRPISQSLSYINRLPPELLETICDFLRARPSAKYLVRTRPPVVDRYNYWTNPIDTASYVRARRALRALCLVSTRFRDVAQRRLFGEIWITDLQSLFGLVISLGLYPHNRAHVKQLGISEAFFINCQENDCECGGTIEGCHRRNRHHVNWGTDKDLEYTCWDVFNTVLKIPSVLRTFPDVRQILEMQQELEVRLTDGWHWMSDATFERVCNLALKLIIFFSPDLRSLRLTAPLGTASSPYIFRYALGLIPLPTTNLGTFPIPISHAHNCAQFLTKLSIDLSSLRVCYGRHLLDGRASRCLTSIEDLTVVDDGEVQLGSSDTDRCSGIEPDFLQVWLQPAKRLKKFRLYSGFDLEGLASGHTSREGGDPLGFNINTILLGHQDTLEHFEWCQMVSPRIPTDEANWTKMFGEEQRFTCLPHLKELVYLKLSDTFVYTRQQLISRGTLGGAGPVAVRPPQQPPPPVAQLLLPLSGIPAPIPTQRRTLPNAAAINPRRLMEMNIRSVLAHNLSELGTPPKLRSVDVVVGNLPTDRCLTIEL